MRKIRSGDLDPRAPLPSERALESEFSVHRATIRRALNRLKEQGILTQAPGDRAYVTSAKPTNFPIGVLAGFREEPYARLTILEGVCQAIARETGSFSAFSAPATELSVHLEKGALGGLVLLPPHDVNRDKLREFRRHRAVVVIDRMIPGFETDFIGFQDFEAGYEAAKHLFELGHRRIAFLGPENPETARDRRRGVEAFCEQSGAEFSWNFSGLATGARTPEGFLESVFGLVRKAWPTGAVCTNDETAAHMIVSLERLGVRVPDDMALIGFGNAHSALLDALDLTTMAQPYFELGQEAFRLIAGRIEGQVTGDPQEIRLPMQLVPRGSSACSTIAAGQAKPSNGPE